MADQLLKELGISDGVTLQLNTLGDRRRARPGAGRWSSIFARTAATCRDESQARLESNPLRILDSKDPRDRSAVESAPGIDECLTERRATSLRP